MSDSRIFTVDKFLGINESADGTTELKLGEASKIENFYITDGYNLKTRPGVVPYFPFPGDGSFVDRAYPFYMSGEQWLITIEEEENCNHVRFFKDKNFKFDITTGFTQKIFLHDGKVWMLMTDRHMDDESGYGQIKLAHLNFDSEGNIAGWTLYDPYEPLCISGRSPSGANSTTIENLNILTDRFNVQFISDGETAEYLLPSNVSYVGGVHWNNAYQSDVGTFSKETNTFTFKEDKIPEKDMEVEFSCSTEDADLKEARDRFLKMLFYEHYNGATDSRIFFYGDGSNLCYYTGIPAHGSGFYVPAMNELRVDFSDSPITAMVRHYSRLLVFKPDGVESIVYEPITLEDGKVIAGFYLRPINREYGNEAMNQLTLVNNYPRTFSNKSIFDWKITSTQYRDERYAKCVSQKVCKTIEQADFSKIVAYDDDASKTYYVFLNDNDGTVLVHRYDLDVWSIYKSDMLRFVEQVLGFDGSVLLLRNGKLYTFDESQSYDNPGYDAEKALPIQCEWESGFMAFGADFRRKYSSNLWVSLLPDYRSWLEVTVQTDKRNEYLTKIISNALASFSHFDFGNLSFQTYAAPKIRRIKLKVKKFVYYKLILRVTKPGSTATVLGYDQQIRYSSNVK